MNRKYIDFDDTSEDGVFAIPNRQDLRIRELLDYCKQQGKSLDALTEEEIKKFED